MILRFYIYEFAIHQKNTCLNLVPSKVALAHHDRTCNLRRLFISSDIPYL